MRFIRMPLGLYIGRGTANADNPRALHVLRERAVDGQGAASI